MKQEKKIKREKPIPKKKLDSIKDMIKEAKAKKTILIASIKNLPSSQYNEIKKKLRGKAMVMVPKKNMTLRAFESFKELKELETQVKDNVAILFSDLDSFELASELTENRSAVKAKTGQEAPEDIEIQPGPTDLVPGPAISELGALGIQIMIEGGKINIKSPKVIVKKGQKIPQNAAEIMNKLDIKPFTVGFEPIAAFDMKEGKLYLNIKVDKKQTLDDLKIAYGKSLPFAVSIGYISKDTIKLLIAKAGRQEKALVKYTNAPSENKSEEGN
jgi:large subunit ribosomal protein L10